MREQLGALLDSRSASETKVLHDLLKKLRYEFNASECNSSTHIHAAMRACSDYIAAFADGALNDYRRAISADSKKYGAVYLSDATTGLLARLTKERENVQGILDERLGPVAKALGSSLQDYKAFAITCESVLSKAKAEAEIINATILEAKPSLLSVLKGKWESHPILVIFAGTAMGVIFLAGLLAAVQTIREILDKWLG